LNIVVSDKTKSRLPAINRSTSAQKSLDVDKEEKQFELTSARTVLVQQISVKLGKRVKAFNVFVLLYGDT
jgi:hypothetical protein